MPDHTEKVELQFESRVPSRSDVAGVHHVLKMLSEIERRIQNINRMSVAPQGIQGANTASAASAMERYAVALNRVAEAQSRVAKTVRTAFPESRGGGGTFERHSNLGPGIRQIERFGSLSPSGETLESTKVITDMEKIAATQRKAADQAARARQEEARRRQLDREFQATRTADIHAQANEELNARAKLQQALQASGQRAQRDKEVQAKADERHAQQLRRAQQKTYDDAKRESEKKPPRMPSEKKGPLFGFTPEGLGLNVLKVSQWALAVTVLYKSFELAQYSLSRLVEIGQQTQRLSQVFTGVGGSAQELTRDILGLAAANGRSTEEAMEAGIAWSRLQLNRVEVNEAVRVSLMAANVAEMTAADSTKALSSIYVTYGLRVSQLAGVLGMLNQSSNTFNVTNRDLLDGLSRSASVARQAGIGFAELQGLITGGVSRSGQSGSNIGNALKTTLVRLNNPNVQEVLRDRFNVEATTKGGEDMKSGSDILRELFVSYQGLNREERANMAIRIAGATQANRFIAIMDSYVQAQKAAIASEENLNSAEIENAKILNSVKAQWVGMKSEFDKFTVVAGNSTIFGTSINTDLINYLTSIRGVLSLINSDLSNILPKWLRTLGSTFAGGFNPVARVAESTANIVRFFSPDKTDFGGQLENSANQHGHRASSLDLRSRLLQSISQSVGANPSLLGQAKSIYGPGFEQVNAGNASEMLSKRSAEFSAQSKEERSAEITAKEQLLILADAEIKTEEAGANNAGKLNKLYEEQRKLRESSSELANQQRQIDGDAADEFQGNIRKSAILLGQQRAIVEQISGLFDQMPIDTATAKLEVHLRKLLAEKKVLEETKNAFEARGGNDAFKQSEELSHEIRKKQGEIAGASSAFGLAGEFDARGSLLRADRSRSQRYGVGLDEAERLNSMQAGLTAASEGHRLMADRLQLAGQEVEARREVVRALEAEKQILEVLEQKDNLRNKLAVDLKNLTLEQKKQYAESLLLSGPGDLLRKLSVKQLADRSGGKLNLGDFMALSPDARKDYLEYTGDFKARDIRRQMGLLGAEQSDEGRVQGEANRNARIRGLIQRVGPTADAIANSGLSSETMKASNALSSFTIILGQVNASLAAFDSRLASMFGGPEPSSIGHPIESSGQGAFVGPDQSRDWFNAFAANLNRPRLTD